MKSANRHDFELPDYLEVGSDDDEDRRMGAGSTLPQDLFPLGAPGPAAERRDAEHASPQPMQANDGDTLPPDLADVPTAASLTPTIPATPLAEMIVAAPSSVDRLPSDGPMPKRILVVDDDLTARLYMRTRLMLRGHVQLMEAANGAQALQILQTQDFDAVLLDVDMGLQNGFEVCRAVRSWVRQQRGKQPTICMITSRSSMIDKMRAKMAGADAFLSKPPHPAELASFLSKL